MNKLLTISIAAYNVENTIEKCLDSFLSCRHLNNLEILVINDGSYDRTAELVAVYEQKYPESIRLINKKNGGHGSTLNTSLELANGKFYKAVDGDDWVDSSELDKLCDYLEQMDADLFVDNYKEVYPDYTKFISLQKGYALGEVYQFDEIFRDGSYGKNLFVMQTSTIRTQRLRDVGMKIQEHCFYVDTELYFYIGLSVRTIVFLDTCTYRYRLGRNGQSVSAEGYYNHIEDLINVEKNLLRLWSSHAPKIKGTARGEYLFSIIDTRYSMLFGIYTQIIQKKDKDKVFVDFIEFVQAEYPSLVSAFHLSWINRYIVVNPAKRIPWMRKFRKTFLFKILYTIKHIGK